MDWLSVAVALVAAALTALLLLRPSGRSTVPKPWLTIPVVGETLDIVRCPSKYFLRRFLQYGPVFRFNFFGIPDLHVICDHDAAKALFKSTSEDGRFYAPGASFRKILGTLGDYMTISERHRTWRKIMNQCLSTQGIAAMLPHIDKVIKTHVDRWVQQGEIKIEAHSRGLALSLGVGVISGVPVDDSNRDEVLSLASDVINGVFDPFALEVPGMPVYKAIKARNKLQAMLWDAIAERASDIVAKVEREKDQDEVQGHGGADTAHRASEQGHAEGGYMTMLEAQLKAAAQYYTVDAELAVDRALGNILGATDTTRVMLLVVLSCVGLSGRVRAKLVEEQQQFLVSHGDDLSYRTLCAMTYLDATIKEALRLLPATILLFRELGKPLQVGDHTLPVGTICAVNTHLMHAQDPALNKDAPGAPEVNEHGLPPYMDFMNNFEGAFQPERWLSEETRPKSYFTFGSGTHLCLGVNIAYAEARLMVARLLRTADLELCDKDMFKKLKSQFPSPVPTPGTDTIGLVRRKLQPAVSAS